MIVFGILIALQIDNWNEYQKDRAFEKSILKDIQSSLKEDVVQLKGSEKRAGRMIRAIKQLLTLPEYQDSLKFGIYVCSLVWINLRTKNLSF